MPDLLDSLSREAQVHFSLMSFDSQGQSPIMGQDTRQIWQIPYM